CSSTRKGSPSGWQACGAPQRCVPRSLTMRGVPSAACSLPSPRCGCRSGGRPATVTPRKTLPAPAATGSSRTDPNLILRILAAERTFYPAVTEKAQEVNQKRNDAGWLRGQTTRRRKRCFDGGSKHRSVRFNGGLKRQTPIYTGTPCIKSRIYYDGISGEFHGFPTLLPSPVFHGQHRTELFGNPTKTVSKKTSGGAENPGRAAAHPTLPDVTTPGSPTTC